MTSDDITHPRKKQVPGHAATGYLDGLAEFVETSDETPGLNGFGPAVEAVEREIVVEGAMFEQM